MKKILFTISMLAVALGFTACSSEDDILVNENQNPGKMIITAYTESKASSRTALAEDGEGAYDVVWSEGDHFFAYQYDVVTGKYKKVKDPFTLISGANTTKGTFERKSGDLGLGLFQVLYLPDYYISSPSTLQDEYLAKNQTYAEGKIPSLPMQATFLSASMPIHFENIGGILRMNVKGTATVKSIEVSAAELGDAKITLDCGDGVALTSEGKAFYIAMPAKTYTGVEITLTDTDDKTCTKKFKGKDGLVIERSQITKASFTASDFKSAVTYNVGDKVEFGGHEGIVVNIAGTLVAVATMNVGATAVSGKGCLGSYMTYDDACKAWSGWRLPTVDEIKTLCDVIYPTWGDTMEGEGRGALLWYIDDKDGIDLYLPLNDNDDQNPYDKYWTGTPGENDTEKCFYFAPELDWESGSDHDYTPVGYEWRGKDGVLPYKEEAAKTNTYLVRLFHDLP